MASHFDFDSVLKGLEVSSKKLYEEKKFKEVEDMLTTFIKDVSEEEADPESRQKILARAYNDRGHAKYMRVEFEAAVLDYDQAISHSDRLAAAYFNRATVKYRLGDPKEALSDFLRATQLEPDNADFKEGLETCRSQSNVQAS